jgi:uncharacterized protein (UPF0332 family)
VTPVAPAPRVGAAVARPYARALLHVRGLEVKSHTGALQLLHREFIKSGEVKSVLGWQLSGLQRSREIADDDQTSDFTPAEVTTLLAIADSFGREAMQILRANDAPPPTA